MGLAILIITAVTAIGAILAAIGAFLSARSTRLSAQGQLFITLLRDYSSKEMFEALKKLTWLRTRQADGSDYWDKLVDCFKKNRDNPKNIDDVYPDVNEARRRVVHYFLTTLELYQNQKCINERFLHHICETQSVGLLYEVAEHLDQALNPEYGREEFDQLLNFCTSKKRKELQRLRPHPKV